MKGKSLRGYGRVVQRLDLPAELYRRQRAHDGPPTHGDQEGSAYHGYYRQYMGHPLLVFDGDTQQLISAILRPGTVQASRSPCSPCIG